MQSIHMILEFVPALNKVHEDSGGPNARGDNWKLEYDATRLGKSTDLEGRYVTRGFQIDELELDGQER